MTRKRFIKLLMSQGYQRNAAQAIAGRVSGFTTYETLYTAVQLKNNPSIILDALTQAIAAAFRVWGEAIQAAGVALAQFAEQFNKGVNNNENN